MIQLSLVYINTLMIQQVLAEPAWAERLNAQDLRASPRLSTATSILTAASVSICIRACPSIRPVSAHSLPGTQMLLVYDQLTG